MFTCNTKQANAIPYILSASLGTRTSVRATCNVNGTRTLVRAMRHVNGTRTLVRAMRLLNQINTVKTSAGTKVPVPNLCTLGTRTSVRAKYPPSESVL